LFFTSSFVSANDEKKEDHDYFKPDRFEVYYFKSSWCGYCKQVTPYFDEISKEKPNVKSFKIDIDSNPDIAQKFNVRSVPTLCYSIVFSDTKEHKKSCFVGSTRDTVKKVFDLVDKNQQ
jgi:thiol-disulfide isomerase/thioredoxin